MSIVFRLDHDFNEGRNEGGFHEVMLPAHIEGNFHRGDSVILTDGEVEVRGRIRCLVAVVEDTEPASGSAGGATKPHVTPSSTTIEIRESPTSVGTVRLHRTVGDKA